MNNTEVYSFEDTGDLNINQKYEDPKTASHRSIRIRSISMSILAFFIGRVSLIGGLAPFGVAYFASSLSASVSSTAICTSLILATLTWMDRAEFLFKQFSIMVLFWIISSFVENAKSVKSLARPIILFISVLTINIFPMFFKTFILYDLAISIFEAAITVMIYYILRRGINLLLADNKKNFLEVEEVISLSVVGILAIAGFRNISLLGIEIRSLLCIFAVLLLARFKGAGVGAATGICMGMISVFTNSDNSIITINVISSYALSGLMAGLFRPMGNIGIILGFITGNAVLTYFLNGSTEILISFRDIIISSIMLYMMPAKVINKIGSNLYDQKINLETAVANEQLINNTNAVQKLSAFSKAVEELAFSFESVPQPEFFPNKDDITDFIDSVVDRVCKQCKMCDYCWERKFHATYQTMFEIMEILEKNSKISLEEVRKCFNYDSCAKTKDMVGAINNLYELYRVNTLWKKRLGESRGIVSQQLQGVSKIIAKIANDIDTQFYYSNEFENKIKRELQNNNWKVAKIKVFYDEDNNMKIEIRNSGCFGENKCRKEMNEIISNAVGKNVCRTSMQCGHGKLLCQNNFVCCETYDITFGVCKRSKSLEVSGDSYTNIELSDGKYIIGLSDGMGYGRVAANSSQTAINLLEKFLESGFDKNTAVKIINSALVLKSADHSYATLDISAVDLYTGMVEFVKIGAVPTYIKRKDRIETIKGASLPAGILANIDMDLCDRQLEPGDFLVMVTDGVTEVLKAEDGYKEWITDFLENTHLESPQLLAESIILESVQLSGGFANDDMTVLVAKLWAKSP